MRGYVLCAQISSDPRIENARLDKKTYEAVQRLHFHWYMTSIKALMGQLGKELYQKMNVEDQAEFARCLDNIEYQGDLSYGARCLVHARKRHIANTPRKTNKKLLKQKFIKIAADSPTERHNAPFAKKPELDSKSKKEKSSGLNKSPKVIAAKVKSTKKLKEILKMKMRKKSTRIKRSEYGRKKAGVIQMEKLMKLIDPTRPSPVQRVTNLITRVTQGNDTKYQPGAWLKTYKELRKLKDAMDEKKQLPGTRAFKYRLYDLILGNDKPTKSPKEKMQPATLLDSAFDLIESVAEQKNNGTRQQGNIRVMSPRIAPLMPDKLETKSRPLSPSILAFFKDEGDDQIASIPEVLEKTGMDDKDRESIMEMLMEVSGARKNVNMALEILNNLNFKGMKGEILEVTERLSAAFQHLQQSFSNRQHDEIKERGFTFMEPHQMERICKDHGPDNVANVGFDISEYRNLTVSQREASLWQRIELIAANKTDEDHKREKRAFQVLSVLAPVILAPYMFNPIFGISILGPVILSPNIFSPLILNPSVLVLLLALPATQAQSAFATFAHQYITNFFQVSEIQKIETAIANQVCQGASVEQIFDNFANTVSQNIGGMTAVNAVGLLSKLQNDLGGDFTPIRGAASANAANLFNPILADVYQYCGQGIPAVIAEADNYANNQFVQSFFDTMYQAVVSVNQNDWSICRNDLDRAVFFSNWGY
ncbi:hypothetical protein QR680_015756 [Steinernema hermaphroditum]|uniref:Uncharacterized protein n=1 Tax=Steinernema hermaphroditum TaxID=289476 RepID=A0AA39LLA5_9BILA|nr:hypothetical protein QR680_015756 [Steinernema hermaphroditum]